MNIVKYKNQSGVTYAYEQTSVYDPEKKQSRPKRKYLGRVDPETGEIISAEGRKGRPPKAKNTDASTPDSEKGIDSLEEGLFTEGDRVCCDYFALFIETKAVSYLIEPAG